MKVPLRALKGIMCSVVIDEVQDCIACSLALHNAGM